MDDLILDVVEQDGDINALTARILKGFDEVSVPSDVPPYESVPLAIALRNRQGDIQGGVTGHSVWDWLYIRYLWVAKAYRGCGQGKRLLDAAEDMAYDRACSGIWLHTLSFQAPAFYERQGYERFGELEDMPKGHRRLFYRKTLSPRFVR